MSRVAKKFINDSSDVVEQAIEGYCMSHPGVVRLEGTHVVALKDIDRDAVALVCGGGSGHEPAHLGYVSAGMLSAAVCGQVFASPPASAVSAALGYVSAKTNAGVLVVVKNYQGDVINFGLAVAIAKSQGVNVEMVVIGDDVAFGTQHDARRGVAGTVLLYSILAAASCHQRMGLPQLAELAKQLGTNLRSLGCSMSSCALPGNPPTTAIGADELEIGLGIHGEAGERRAAVCSVAQLVQEMISTILGGGKVAPSWGASGEEQVVLLVNNLGATTDLEMSIIAREALQGLSGRGIVVKLVGVARAMTALEMHGFSLSLLRIGEGDPWVSLLGAHDTVLGKAGLNFHVPWEKVDSAVVERGTSFTGALEEALALRKQEAESVSRQNPAIRLQNIVKTVFEALRSQEVYFNSLDAKVGDGDTGAGVARAANAVLEVVEMLPWATNVPACFSAIGHVVADKFAGTSGALFGAFLVVGSSALAMTPQGNGVNDYAAAFVKGTAAVQEVGGARPGDRTMFDVLHAVAKVITGAAQPSTPVDVSALVEVASQAAASVSNMPASKGRSRYMAGKEVGQLDPGAELVVFWIKAVLSALES